MVWIIFQVPRYHFIAERLLVGDSAVPARVHPKYPFNFCATAFATALSSRPARRSIRRFDAGDLRGAHDGWRGQTGAREIDDRAERADLPRKGGGEARNYNPP